MKILVGLSGGVDSAVAAYLLKQQGHDVTCAFMRNWDSLVNNDIKGNDQAYDDVCPQEADFNDAKAVAKLLDLPLQRVDFIKEYWDEVFTNFIEENKKGRTPNPDILCNKYIKFDHFLDYALQQGFDYVATGHYAKVVHSDNESLMYKACDKNKDQTYFLAQISRFALQHTLFPLADLQKPEIREIAKQLNLSIATKKDSTGICFIGERHFREFMQNYLPAQAGDIVNVKNGEVLKQHVGVFFYTLGQRKGLDIGGAYGPWFVVGKNVEKNILYVANGNDDDWLVSDRCDVSNCNWFVDFEGGAYGPWFVVGKNVEKNILYVANGNDDDWLVSDRCDVSNCNWFVDFEGSKPACAKFRYRQQDIPVTLEKVDDTHVKVIYPQGVKAVTPGQQAVFYEGDCVLGGGVIDTIYRNNISLDERINQHLCQIKQ